MANMIAVNGSAATHRQVGNVDKGVQLRSNIDKGSKFGCAFLHQPNSIV